MIHEANMNLTDGEHLEWFVVLLTPLLRSTLSYQKLTTQVEALEIAMRLHETPLQDHSLGVQKIHAQLKNLYLKMQSLKQAAQLPLRSHGPYDTSLLRVVLTSRSSWVEYFIVPHLLLATWSAKTMLLAASQVANPPGYGFNRLPYIFPGNISPFNFTNYVVSPSMISLITYGPISCRKLRNPQWCSLSLMM